MHAGCRQSTDNHDVRRNVYFISCSGRQAAGGTAGDGGMDVRMGVWIEYRGCCGYIIFLPPAAGAAASTGRVCSLLQPRRRAKMGQCHAGCPQYGKSITILCAFALEVTLIRYYSVTCCCAFRHQICQRLQHNLNPAPILKHDCLSVHNLSTYIHFEQNLSSEHFAELSHQLHKTVMMTGLQKVSEWV